MHDLAKKHENTPSQHIQCDHTFTLFRGKQKQKLAGVENFIYCSLQAIFSSWEHSACLGVSIGLRW